MDQAQYSSLVEALAAVPDPRQARGKQRKWSLILGVIAGAMLSQHRSVAAMAQWAQRHAAALGAAWQPTRHRVPRESTLRRALRRIDDLLWNRVGHRCRYQIVLTPTGQHHCTVKPWTVSTSVGQARMARAST